jgi:hypothetical protein
MAVWTFWILSGVICQGVFILSTFESTEVPQEPQSLFLVFFRVELDGADIITEHGAGEFNAPYLVGNLERLLEEYLIKGKGSYIIPGQFWMGSVD